MRGDYASLPSVARSLAAACPHTYATGYVFGERPWLLVGGRTPDTGERVDHLPAHVRRRVGFERDESVTD